MARGLGYEPASEREEDEETRTIGALRLTQHTVLCVVSRMWLKAPELSSVLILTNW